MRTIGLIGGMSWESSAEYYRIINQQIRERLGPLRLARLVLYSVDFGPIEQAQQQGRWDEAALILAGAARSLYSAGAEAILLCTNTMHCVADAIQAAVPVPFLHIADPVWRAAQQLDAQCVGLLGTAYTMEQAFMRERLSQYGQLRVLVPPADERAQVHRVIYQELCAGVVNPASREIYRQVIAGLAARGARAVVLGCTEIGLLVKTQDSPLPLLDTTLLHAAAAVDFALA